MTYAQNMPTESYQSARGRATAIKVLVILQIVMLACATFAWWSGASSLEGSMTGAAAAFTTAGVLESINGLLFLAATVVFLTWVYRSIANLQALGSMSCTFTPSGAVWSWFIPFVNLVRGHQVMATIWTESQPPVVNENGFYLPRKATVVHWWWGLYLFTAVAGVFGTNARPFGVEELRSLAETQVFLHLLRVAVAILFLLMISGAQQRQDEQWNDLERQRSVPKPSADFLR
jgi:hypothetical protein